MPANLDIYVYIYEPTCWMFNELRVLNTLDHTNHLSVFKSPSKHVVVMR